MILKRPLEILDLDGTATNATIPLISLKYVIYLITYVKFIAMKVFYDQDSNCNLFTNQTLDAFNQCGYVDEWSELGYDSLCP